MKKYYQVFAIDRQKFMNQFVLKGTFTNKKEACKCASDFHGIVTKTVQDDGNNQGRIIVSYTQGNKYEI